MRTERIVELKKEVERIEKKFDALLKRLGSLENSEGRAFDISKTIPNTDSSLSDIRARHAAIAGLATKFDSNGSTLAPIAYFNSTTNALRSIGNAQDQIEAELQTIESWGGLRSVDYDTFAAVCGNGNARDLSAAFKTLFDNCEIFLEDFYNLFNIVRPSKSAFNFAAAARSLKNAISTGSSLQSNLEQKLLEAETRIQQINEEYEKVAGTAQSAQESTTQILEDLSKSSQATGEISVATDRIKEVRSEATALQVAINEFSEKFEHFDLQLETRERRMREGTDSLNELLGAFVEQEAYISAIVEQSDNMLSGATVAGLSSEFKNIRDELTTEVKNARQNFNLAIAFLFASSIPLIVFIFAPIFGPMLVEDDRLLASVASAGSEKSGWQYVGQVLARFIILLPAIWFVTFATGRYNALFKLREHYSYKYSMAVAVEGFKKQAPGHEDMIAALVFEQLAFNPADKMGKQPDGPETPPNPIAKLLVDSLRKVRSGG